MTIATVPGKQKLCRKAVLDANYKNRGELLLRHLFEGIPLDEKYAEDVLKNLSTIWRRPVHITTKDEEGMPIMMRYNNGNFYKKTRNKKKT